MKPKAILLLVAFCLVGCNHSDNTNPSTTTSGDSDKRRVALIMKSLANEFFSTMADGAKTHHADHAADYDLVDNGIKDERDLARQVALVDEMVASGVDAIVIAPAVNHAAGWIASNWPDFNLDTTHTVTWRGRYWPSARPSKTSAAEAKPTTESDVRDDE